MSEVNELLRDQAARLLRGRDNAGILRALLDAPQPAFDRSLWTDATQLGWCGVLIDEAYGGVGAGWPALSALAEELGRAAAAIPFSPGVAVVGEAISRWGTSDQKSRWLPPIAAGHSIPAVAFADEGAIRLAGDRATGTLAAVCGAAFADILLIVAPDAVLVCDTPSALTINVLTSIDPSRGTADVTFADCKVDQLARQASPDLLRAYTALVNAFEAIGGAAICLETACGYARERHAFGQPIGRFQAIKHLLADDYARLEVARGCAGAALDCSDNADTASADLLAAAAAAHLAATRAYEAAARNLVHIHGGIGVTWDADCHLHMRRARVLALELGGPHVWRDRLVQGWLDSQPRTAVA